jgi:PAS domain S-box-containing protein
MTPLDARGTGEDDGYQPPFRLLAEMASDVAMEIDSDNRVVWISHNIEEVLGWSVDEIVGTSIFDRMHPDDVARGAKARDRVMSGNVVRNDLRFLTKDGVYRWMSARLAPVHDEHGNVVGRVAGWHDVSPEYELRDQLREREERFRFLVENANDVVLLQVEGEVVFVSPAVERVLGWSPEELIGREVATLWHHDDQDAAAELHTTSLRANSSNVMRMRHKDGSVRRIEISASPVTQPDGRAGAVSILRDVTETVEAERRLAGIQARDAVLASMSSDLFLILDRAGAILWASGASEFLFGRSSQELIGINVVERLVSFGGDGSIRARLKAGEMVAGVIEVHPIDGPSRWIDVRAMQHSHLPEPDSWLFVSIRDAQAEMETRAALEASEREANEANHAKTAFLSRMSHELRTPLNAILGFAQLLQLEQLTPAQGESIDNIVTGGRHLLDLINEVLDIARIESGLISISPGPMPVSDVISESIELVRGMAASADVDVEPFDASGCSVVVVADRQRMIQILLNLLSNAVKYNRQSGTVRVRCGHAEDGMARIEVEDNGPGIAPDLLHRLFQPFDRLGAERTGIEGTGIGLAVARSLAETMGGRLEVRSNVGSGSVFTLVLPLADTADSAEVARPS